MGRVTECPPPSQTNQTTPPWQSRQCVWMSQVEGFLGFPPSKNIRAARWPGVCVFRCQRPSWNTGPFFSSPYGRLYSNLILNHPDRPTLLPLLWLVQVALLMLDFKKQNKGGVMWVCFQSRVNLDSCAHRYGFSQSVCVHLQCNKGWPL